MATISAGSAPPKLEKKPVKFSNLLRKDHQLVQVLSGELT